MGEKSDGKKATTSASSSSGEEKAAAPVNAREIICDTCERKKFKRYFRKLHLKPPIYSATCLVCESEAGKLPKTDKEYRTHGTRRQHHLIQEEKVRRELAHRELCRRKLIPYVKRHETNYLVGWLHDKIARELERFLDDVVAGKSPRLMFFVPPRHGKLCIHTAPVLTPGGWTTHGELRPGDQVYAPDGKPTTVVALSREGQANYEVEFTNGERVVVHANHEWAVHDRRKSKAPLRVVETQDIAADVWIGEPGKRGGRARWQLPDVQFVRFERKELPLDPYVLGVWLGDGSANKPCITNSEEDSGVFQEAFASAGYPCTSIQIHSEYGTHAAYFYRTELMQDLRAAGVFENKHIPETYLRGSTEQRLELLAGLLDSDGHVEPYTGRCRIVTTSEALRNGIMDLCTTLGFRPYVSSVPATISSSGAEGRHTVYTIGFQPDREVPTRIPRKCIEQFAIRRRVSIKAVRRVAPQPGRCIQVDSPDGLYLVGHSLVPTHNSLLVSDFFISWAIGKYPWLEIISSSYSSSLPVKFSRRIRSRLMSKKHQAVFPEAELSKDSRNVEHWTTTKGGGYLAAGVGGGITGHGAHIFSIDDPIKDAEEADSETIRDGHWDWWSSTASTRVAPGGGVIVTQTRWHDDDLSGRMLRNVIEMRDEGVPEEEIEEWRVIAFPAIADDDEYELEEGDIYVGSIAELAWEKQQTASKLRSKGDALHEARWPLSYLKKKRRAMQPRHWSALFQQNPVPDEGITFTKDMFLIKPASMRSPQEMVLLAAWDLAIGKRAHHDWTVGMLGGLDYHGDLILLDCIRGRWGTFGIVEAILNMYARYPTIQRIGIERGQLELAIGDSLKARMDERRLYPRLDRTLVPIQDKEKRAAPLQGLMQHHKVYFPSPSENPWVLRAQDELLRFPAGVHEDIVDALAWLARMAQKTTPPKPPQPKRPTSWKDELDKHIAHGSKHDPMAA